MVGIVYFFQKFKKSLYVLTLLTNLGTWSHKIAERIYSMQWRHLSASNNFGCDLSELFLELETIMVSAFWLCSNVQLNSFGLSNISKYLAVLSFETKIMSDRECQQKWLPINGFYRVRSHILGDILNFVSLMVIHCSTYCTVNPTFMFTGFVWIKIKAIAVNNIAYNLLHSITYCHLNLTLQFDGKQILLHILYKLCIHN